VDAVALRLTLRGELPSANPAQRGIRLALGRKLWCPARCVQTCLLIGRAGTRRSRQKVTAVVALTRTMVSLPHHARRVLTDWAGYYGGIRQYGGKRLDTRSYSERIPAGREIDVATCPAFGVVARLRCWSFSPAQI